MPSLHLENILTSSFFHSRFNVSDFEVIFQIPVSKAAFLVNLVGSVPDNISYLEGMIGDGSASIFDTIRVKLLTETHPELRLARLVQRQRFDEAKEFARKFHLKPDSIYQAHAASLVARFNLRMNDDIQSSDVDEFFAVLDKIADVKYVFDCCSNTLMNEFKQTRRLLLYTEQRIVAKFEVIR